MTAPDRSLRFGILGTAKITRRLVPAIRKAHNAELVAIASRDLLRATTWAQEYDVDTTYGSYQDLLDAPDIDAVYIPLPPSMHHEWTIRAAAAGKHVLCEKPLSLSSAEAEEMATACQEHGVQLMDGVMWMHHDRTPAMKEVIEAEDFGPLRRVTSGFSVNMLDELEGNFRLVPELGGGSLLDLGYYCVGGVLWAFNGLPGRVYASARYQGGVDLNFSGMMWFDDNRIASIDCGFDTSFRTWIEVSGAGGSLVCDRFTRPQDDETAAFYVHKGFEDSKVSVPNRDQIVRMVETFSNLALAESPDPHWPQRAIDTMRVCEALSQSARDEQVVELPPRT